MSKLDKTHIINLQIIVNAEGWEIYGQDNEGVHRDSKNWYSGGNCHEDLLSDIDCSLRYELMMKGVLLQPKNHDDPPVFIYEV